MANIIVVGGGPAGMMAAIRSAQLGNKVVLLEKNQSLGKKLLLTGQGRCNLTNACQLDDFMGHFSRKGQFLRDAFKLFFNDQLIDFFEKRGLPLKTERQKRVFPVTDSSRSILNVLKKELSSLGVEVLYNTVLKKIEITNRHVSAAVSSDNKKILADKIILATGGASYTSTGSNGQGHRVAKELGHDIEHLRPALVPLRLSCNFIKALEGISLKNIRVCFTCNKKVLSSDIGEMLFTDNGVSGPLVLSMSADIVDMLKSADVFMDIDLKPALDIAQLQARLLKEIQASPGKSAFNLLKALLPARMVKPFLFDAGIGIDIKSAHITREQRKKIQQCLKSWRFDVAGPVGMDKAMLTRGGISLKDIDPKTMQSRHIKGLYFAGEIIDVDADTGGFNLQAAFSTGYLAGSS